jgi:hypothetical protein
MRCDQRTQADILAQFRVVGSLPAAYCACTVATAVAHHQPTSLQHPRYICLFIVIIVLICVDHDPCYDDQAERPAPSIADAILC